MDRISLTVQRVVSRLLSFKIEFSPIPVGMKISSRDLIYSCFTEVVESIGRYIFYRSIFGLNLLISVTARVFPLLEYVSEGV